MRVFVTGATGHITSLFVPAGARLQRVGDEAVPFRAITETTGRHLNLPVVSIAPQPTSDGSAPSPH
jgi:hypothetical protein